jgi:transcriptional regulator with XRE-family HTH domain
MNQKTRINLKVKIIGSSMTIQDLSYKIKVSTQVIYRVIRGESDPTLGFVRAISWALGIPVWELFPEDFDKSGIGIMKNENEPEAVEKRLDQILANGIGGNIDNRAL